MDSGIGEWEKHTKGIGTKLLLQMGYEPGKGLGKSLQGRCQPVEAEVQHKGRGSPGMYGPEIEIQGNHKNPSPIKPNCLRNLTTFTNQKCQKVICDDNSETSYRVKAHKGLNDRKQLFQINSTLIDKKAKKHHYQFEELFYNLDILVDHCKHDIEKNSNELVYKQNHIMEIIEAQMKKMSVEISKDTVHIEMLQSISSFIEQLEEMNSKNDLSMEFIWEQIIHLKQAYLEEFESSDLPIIILIYLIPLANSYISTSWHPMVSKSTDKSCRLLFLRWRPVLEYCNEFEFVDEFQNLSLRPANGTSIVKERASQLDPYHRFLWYAWMPTFRCLVCQWNCKPAEPMIDLLESWKHILPNWIMENILDELILPKIQNEVECWNSSGDIHFWIHPWLPLLGSKLEIIYPKIQYKMERILTSWKPSDNSARALLLPWARVFPVAVMNAFLMKNILPKLQAEILNWDISPSRQQLDAWYWIMDWKDVVPLQSLVQLLTGCFFPKWLQTLVAWLNNNPNYEEIADWYTDWKALFPLELIQNSAIQEQFIRALNLMNRSLPIEDRVNFTPPLPIKSFDPGCPSHSILDTIIPHGLRELIEYRCAQQGILCVPLVNRFHAGRSVFRVGNVLCYFEREVIFVLSKGIWIPVTAQQLLNMAIFKG